MMIETLPSRLRRSIRSRIIAPSLAPIAASGSSSSRMSASECTVRATAIACRWPPDRRATGAFRLGMLMPISSSASRVSARIVRLAAQEHPALGRLLEAADDLHQRRLAGAVVPQQAEDFALVQAQVDVAQRLDRAEALGHAFDAQD